MRFRRITEPLLLLAFAGSFPLAAQNRPAVRLDRCYLLSYSDARVVDSIHYAATLWLAPDTNRGQVQSHGFMADTTNFWRMFRESGRWVQHGDTLQLQFDNGFSFVTYDLRTEGDSLRGLVRISFDFKGGEDPTARVVARLTRCPPRRPEARSP
jgi:hypothetical protein